MRVISKFIFKIIGWKLTGGVPSEVKKCVMIIAPHTSFIDAILGRLAFWIMRIKARFIIKKEFFKFPLGLLIKALGGIPIDRSKGNIIKQSVSLFNESESLVIVITPEGTRKYTDRWKNGFYHIARHAEVPIILGFLDYKKKEAGIREIFYPTGDYEKDWKYIEDFYRGVTAKFPENFNLSN